MPEILLNGRKIDSVFNLIGEKENDITFSIGWALSRSPTFLQRFLQAAFGTTRRHDLKQTVVSLQEFRKVKGITDVEIRDPNLQKWEMGSVNKS